MNNNTNTQQDFVWTDDLVAEFCNYFRNIPITEVYKENQFEKFKKSKQQYTIEGDKRIEVKNFDYKGWCINDRGNTERRRYEFSLTDFIPDGKVEAVKQVIEAVLNNDNCTLNFNPSNKDYEVDNPVLERQNAFDHDKINKQLDRIHYLQALGCDLISRIYHYGNFKAETRNERELEKVLNELNLFPTTEDDILKRPPIPVTPPQEVKEPNKDWGWKIVSYKNKETNEVFTYDKIDKNPYYAKGFEYYTGGFREQYDTFEIHSVRRLSDNCVFSVGEEVSTNRNRGKHKIDAFSIIDGDMCVVMSTFPTDNEFLYAISKLPSPIVEQPKQVLFTEDNMRMIFRNAVNAVRQSILENIKWDKVNECCESTIENIKNPIKTIF